MSNYYAKKDAKVRIAHELMNRGWSVEGYHANESDSMTDYYCPAYWDGIATKNGFVLVVDNKYAAEAREITKYNPKGNLSIEDREKISKLEAMTQENGATAGEEENAKKLIKRIQSKITNESSSYEIVGMTTAHMGNPGKCIWHIEKDGKIYDKGNALTKFSDMPESYMFDINKMEYTEDYKYTHEYEWVNGERNMIKKERVLSEEIKKIIIDFKALILRFERVVNGMNTMGDGTKETEQVAQEQQVKAGYEKTIKKIVKKVIKPVQKNDITINVNDVLSFKYHGHYWIVTDKYTNSKGIECITYELLGSEKRGYQRLSGYSLKKYWQPITRVEKELTAGETKIYTLQEVEEVTEVEKWVKIDKSKKTYNTNKESKQKTKETVIKQNETPEPETQETIVLNHEVIITADTDTRDNTPLWVVKFIDKLNYDEFVNIRDNVFKPIKGYYSKFKKGFIFKYDPTSVLKAEQLPEQTTEETKEQESISEPEIKDGFVYDCHFKAWDIPINEIKETVTALNIPFIDLGEKIGFKDIIADQARQVKEISDKNGSIFFIDAESKEMKIYPAEININKAIKSIEIKFINELDARITADLNKNGFRYIKLNNIWYSLYTDKKLQYICSITGNTPEKYKEAV